MQERTSGSLKPVSSAPVKWAVWLWVLCCEMVSLRWQYGESIVEVLWWESEWAVKTVSQVLSIRQSWKPKFIFLTDLLKSNILDMRSFCHLDPLHQACPTCDLQVTGGPGWL